MELLQEEAPRTVSNFLAYVDDGSYRNLMVHRSAPGFVIQSGGFSATLPPTAVATKGTVSNEFGVSNIRGTVAMARVGGETNSATSQWFVNLADNSRLDSVDGGFTVFARVRGDGMSVVDAIARLPVITNFAAPFNELPLRNIKPRQTELLESNLVPIHDITRLPYAVRSSDPAAWSANIVSNNLVTIFPGPRASRPATITVEAADLDGRIAKGTFVVKSAPARTYGGFVGSSAGRALLSVSLTSSGTFTGTALLPDASVLRFSGRLDRTGSSVQALTLPLSDSATLRYVPASDLVRAVTSVGTFDLRPAAWAGIAGDLSPLAGRLANVLLAGGREGMLQLRFDRTGVAKVSCRVPDGSKITASFRAFVGEEAEEPEIPLLLAWKSGPSASISGLLNIRWADGVMQESVRGALELQTRSREVRGIGAAGSFWRMLTPLQPLALRFVFEPGLVAGLPAEPVEWLLTSQGRPGIIAGSPLSSLQLANPSGTFTGRIGSTRFFGLLTGPMESLGAGGFGGGFADPTDGVPARVDLRSP